MRAVLLVAVATWMRAAAGTGGLRETFRRMLERVRFIPSVREAVVALGGLDPGPKLIAAGRAAAARFSEVDLRPAPLCDTLVDVGRRRRPWPTPRATRPRRRTCGCAPSTACS